MTECGIAWLTSIIWMGGIMAMASAWMAIAAYRWGYRVAYRHATYVPPKPKQWPTAACAD